MQTKQAEVKLMERANTLAAAPTSSRDQVSVTHISHGRTTFSLFPRGSGDVSSPRPE